MSGRARGRYDVVVVGGGHNGLVAAAYLARAGLSVLVLERLSRVGGAAGGEQPFAGLPVQVSSHASLVGLLPERIVQDLGLELRLRPRRTASYSPVVRDGRHTGLLIEPEPGAATAESFEALTGSTREYDAWRALHGRLRALADVVAPTLLEPVPTREAVAARADGESWRMLVEEPLGPTVEQEFADDTVRGLVAADALLGELRDLHDPDGQGNRCLLHHAVAPTWRVPLGGMGVVSAALEAAARRHGAELVTEALVTRVESDGSQAVVTFRTEDGEAAVDCSWVLGNVAPWVLRLLLGTRAGPRPEGSMIHVTMLLERLPRLRSGLSSPVAFAGTARFGQGYAELQDAFVQVRDGHVPSAPPGRVVCPSLTDPAVLGPLAVEGRHVVDYLGAHAPARLYTEHLEEQRDETIHRVLDLLNAHLEEPVESLLSLDEDGAPCLRAQVPQDVEAALAMPGGHMFHGSLRWPWSEDDAPRETPAQRWGVETPFANVLVCGSGAHRGGGVSGVGGHNAALAVLESAAGAPVG